MLIPKTSPLERFKSIALGICDTAEPNCVILEVFARRLDRPIGLYIDSGVLLQGFQPNLVHLNLITTLFQQQLSDQ
jgi:hypothetical protein